MTLEELELVRKLVNLVAQVENSSDGKRGKKLQERARAALHEVEDRACEHFWEPFGSALVKCSICKAWRMAKDVPTLEEKP